jgi:hypothetical protein
MSDIKKYASALDSSLKSDSLQYVGVSLAESLTDAVMEEGVARDLPIVGMLVSLAKTGVHIKDRLFLKKIIFFLTELKEIPANKRQEMISRIDNSGKHRIKVGEKLLYILEKCEDHQKAQLIALLFKAFIEEKIDYSNFLKATKVIENSIVEDLEWFIQHDWEDISVEEAAEYINWCLFEIALISMKIKEKREMIWAEGAEYEIEGGELKARITFIGIKIREILKETATTNKG